MSQARIIKWGRAFSQKMPSSPKVQPSSGDPETTWNDIAYAPGEITRVEVMQDRSCDQECDFRDVDKNINFQAPRNHFEYIEKNRLDRPIVL
jgi:hypothetical protein